MFDPLSCLLALLLLGAADSRQPASGGPSPADAPAMPAGEFLDEAQARSLLAATDLSLRAPDTFRTVCRLTEGSEEGAMLVEVWRRGTELGLVRFLDEAHAGKFLLRRGGETWFLAPTSKRAIRLSRRHRLHGQVSLEDLLGLPLSSAFEIRSARREPPTEGAASGAVVFELAALSRKAAHPRVHHRVDPVEKRPLETLSLLENGRVALSIRYEGWVVEEQGTLRPSALTARNPLQGGTTRVEFVEFEEREVPDGLFSIQPSLQRLALTRTGTLSASAPP